MTDKKIHITTNYTFPWFTLGLISLSIALYFAIGFVSDFGEIDEDTYMYFGAPYAVDIYLGQYWGVISNSFVHVLWYQLLANILLLFAFGSFIERRIGFFRLFMFGLIASTITSCFQLSFSNDAGLGLSGVNYSLFGFLLVRNYIDERFKGGPIIIVSCVMFGLFFFCYYLNLFHDWNFGLASMIAGFFWGILVAALPEVKFRWATVPILSVTLSFCIIGLFYAPWSAEWTFAQGVKAHEKGDSNQAKKYYEDCLDMDNGHVLAKENLTILKIDELSQEAFLAHSKGDYSAARKLYLEILKLDKNNRWAKENLSHLP
jgi:membrane associated rhomboid family serine protease